MTNQDHNSLTSKQANRNVRILAINASPRGKQGNTEQILQAFLRGTHESYAIVETVYLRSTHIHTCSGCFTCWTKTPGVCAHKDDMPALLDQIRQADILVYAVPLYSYSVTGLMKNYLDRNLPLALPYMIKEGDQYVHPMRNPEVWPKKLVFISTCGFPERHHFSGLVEMFQRLTSRPALQLAGMILCPGGEILRNPALQETFKWYFDASQRAGREVCQLGHITPETQTILSQPLVPDVDAFAQIANAHWAQVLAQPGKA